MDTGNPIDLAAFLLKFNKCLYEPKESLAAKRRLGPSLKSMVFVTGKRVCVGAKNEDDVQNAFCWLRQQFGN